LGSWLLRQLERRGESQTHLAEHLGLSRAAVSAWVHGRAQPRPEVLMEIAEFLETDLTTVADRTSDAVAPNEVSWYHRPAHADGGREFGNAAAFAYDADLGVLAREVTQNSLDERLDPEQPVRVRFVLHELTGETLRSFLEALRWAELEQHYDAVIGTDRKVAKVLEVGLRELKNSGSLLLLRIEDYNASGLTGSEYGDGRFSAVLRRQLDSNKNSKRAGGSYGLGKATMWATSRLGLVLVNSTLSVPHEGRTERRVLGRLDLPWRLVDDQAYAGPAWLGEPDTDRRHEGVARSWWAEPAEVEALHLARESSAPGTSFLVVGAHDAAAVEVDDETLQKLHTKLVDTLADNFWAAMTAGQEAPAILDASVHTLRNGETVVPESAVVPDRRHPDLSRALRAHLDGTTTASGPLTEPGQVVRLPVPLDVPPRRAEPSGTRAVRHEAVLLVTTASEGDLRNKVVCMRGNRMTVMERSPRDVGLGTHPYLAVLLAGSATGGEGPDILDAEEFLRASEPPEHNRWGRTDELAATYVRGALSRLNEFRSATDATLRQVVDRNMPVGPGPDSEHLREGLRLPGEPESGRRRAARGHPTVSDVAGEITNDGAWSLRVRVGVPAQDDPWRLRPVAKLDVRSGSRPELRWSRLTPIDNCRVENGVLVLEPGVRSAEFHGVTAIESHPVTARMTGVSVEVHRPAKAAGDAT
jgi:DNA-binding XRE family transcriptional regulator